MVMYDHTRNIAYQSKKLADLEEVYKSTSVSQFVTNPRKFSEKLQQALDVTFSHRRGKDYETALGKMLEIMNTLVNNQRLEAKEDLYTLLKEEEAENAAHD